MKTAPGVFCALQEVGTSIFIIQIFCLNHQHSDNVICSFPTVGLVAGSLCILVSKQEEE